MAIPVLAILGVLTTISSVIDHPLVKRLLVNISRGTTTKIDDWVVQALYGEQSKASAALAQVQARYDALTPEERAAAKELRDLQGGLVGFANV